MKVAIQGSPGSFSDLMVSRLFGSSVELYCCKTFGQVFDTVVTGSADKAVIPIENVLTGRIGESTTLLMDTDLVVTGEGYLPIEHCLMASEKVGIESLEVIYAHPEALAQCRQYLSQLNAVTISFYDGAAAAKLVKKRVGQPNKALIASARASELYNLFILAKAIQDVEWNQTRFFVLELKGMDTKITGNDKTSVIFSTKHKPGTLHKALTIFAEKNINLTRLESMPSRRSPFEYVFLLDFIGHKEDSVIAKALDELKSISVYINILGSYQNREEDKNEL